MKLTVKTLEGSHFEIRVQPNDTVLAVKKNIEDIQGKDNYPCGQQLLMYNGKVLKDVTTLADNRVSEDSFLVVMLSKSKSSGSAGASSAQPTLSIPSVDAPVSNPTPTPEVPAQAPVSKKRSYASDAATANPDSDTYSEVASNFIGGNNLEETIQKLMDKGGGRWDKETVAHALRAAYNNPERALGYLNSGIPESAEAVEPVAPFPRGQTVDPVAAPVAPVSGASTSSPLNEFPQETLSGGAAAVRRGPLDFLRSCPKV
ncbi:hypothetical protein DITRI_Ditri02bG0065700 [Diplodiscus trichospermus]